MKRTLGKTGYKINPIGFGGIPIQRLTCKESDLVIQEAVKKGINFFDTSRIYTDSENKLGRVLSKYRDKVVLATKSYSRKKESILQDIETSLKELKTDYLELFQLHNVANEDELNQVMGPNGALEGLILARKKGLIGSIGITGHKPWIIKNALRLYKFDTIQVPCNIIETECLKELIPLARENNAGTIAMKPIAGGALHNIDLNLRFILTSGFDVVIPGMDQTLQIGQNLSVLDKLIPLNEEEQKIVENEKDKLGENFCRRCEYCLPCPQNLPIPFLHLLSAYYFRYQLKDWAWERINSLEKSYQDCIGCESCIKKCPYELNTPKIFSQTINDIRADRKLNAKR